MKSESHLWRVLEPKIESLSEEFSLSESETHYVNQVIRLQPGDAIEICNGKGDVWKAIVKEQSKKRCLVGVVDHQKAINSWVDVSLFVGCPKPSATEELVHLVSELAVPNLVLLGCDHQNPKIVPKLEKLQKIALESMRIHKKGIATQIQWVPEMAKLKDHSFNGFDFYFCDELVCAAMGPQNPLSQQIPSSHLILALQNRSVKKETVAIRKIGIFIGPENSFSQRERNSILNEFGAEPVSLGSAILRTPMAAASAATMALAFFGI